MTEYTPLSRFRKFIGKVNELAATFGEQLNLRSVKTGGTTGQVLKKISDVDFAYTWQTLVKGDVGLGDVDNTSDLAKPISTATQTALDDKVDEGDSRLTDSRPPNGGAGGVLSGSYPNPGFAVDMATQGELDAGLATKQPLDSALTTLASYAGGAPGVFGVSNGLGIYVNTDVDSLPVSTDQQAALDLKANLTGTADIEITDTAKGIVLKSPDASRWRIQVSDLGTLTVTEI